MVFGCVVDVCILRSRVLLEVKVLETIDFNEHLHTFAVHKESGCNVLVWSFDLYDNRVYGIYKQPILRTDMNVHNTKFVVLKYNIY